MVVLIVLPPVKVALMPVNEEVVVASEVVIFEMVLLVMNELLVAPVEAEAKLIPYIRPVLLELSVIAAEPPMVLPVTDVLPAFVAPIFIWPAAVMP